LAAHENHIAEQIRAGDEAVFEMVFRQYYQVLCGYAYRYLQDLDQSEEIVQEFFFKLWKKRAQFIIAGSIEAYLFRSIRNASFNALKHQKIRESYKRSNEQLRKHIEGNPGDPLVALELQLKIDASVEKLPEQRKLVFKMSRYEGLKYREIAEKLGISVKTVEVQMGKALKYLRSELADYLPVLLMVLYLTYIYRAGG
jgi:RNA polymerase sigma-70 factor (ECF subfamily)